MKFITFLLTIFLPLAALASNESILGIQISEGITYKHTPQGDLKLDIYTFEKVSNQKYPVFLFVHGGSWMHGDRKEIQNGFLKEMGKALLLEGYAIVSLDYRLLSERSDVMVHPEQISDCKDGIRWICSHASEYGFDTLRIAMSGTSAGGHLTLMTAFTNNDFSGEGDFALKDHLAKVNCCVDFYGPTDIIKLLKPTLSPVAIKLAKLKIPEKVNMRERLLLGFTGYSNTHSAKMRRKCKQLSPIHYVNTAVPIIIFHGDKDKVVNYHQSVRLVKRMSRQNQTAKLYKVSGGDHGFSQLKSETLTDMIQQM